MPYEFRDYRFDSAVFREYNKGMTTKQTAKLTALRAEAVAHGDPDTVVLVDAALAGDAQAAATLGIAAKAVRAASTGIASTRAPRRQRGFAAASPVHPWAHDEE